MNYSLELQRGSDKLNPLSVAADAVVAFLVFGVVPGIGSAGGFSSVFWLVSCYVFPTHIIGVD